MKKLLLIVAISSYVGTSLGFQIAFTNNYTTAVEINATNSAFDEFTMLLNPGEGAIWEVVASSDNFTYGMFLNGIHDIENTFGTGYTEYVIESGPVPVVYYHWAYDGMEGPDYLFPPSFPTPEGIPWTIWTTNSVGVISRGTLFQPELTDETGTGYFWEGFALVFGAGLFGLSARWVKRLITGSTEETE